MPRMASVFTSDRVVENALGTRAGERGKLQGSDSHTEPTLMLSDVNKNLLRRLCL
jgi:hypothetical protein